MNAEIVQALDSYAENALRASSREQAKAAAEAAKVEPMILSEGLSAISKRYLAGIDALERLYFDVRDLDLEAYIVDRRERGINLTRTEAIREIVRAYLDERGYVHKKSPPA
jgi:hypothetical protein